MPKRRPFKRTDRLNSQIQQALAVALQRETHEEILHQVIVTEVSVTSDLSVARVYYYMMGEVAVTDVDKALRRAAGFLRSRVGVAINARHTPELRFAHDGSVEHGRRIEAILADLESQRTSDPSE